VSAGSTTVNVPTREDVKKKNNNNNNNNNNNPES